MHVSRKEIGKLIWNSMKTILFYFAKIIFFRGIGYLIFIRQNMNRYFDRTSVKYQINVCRTNRDYGATRAFPDGILIIRLTVRVIYYVRNTSSFGVSFDLSNDSKEKKKKNREMEQE